MSGIVELLLASNAHPDDVILLLVSVIAIALLMLFSTVVVSRAESESTQYPHSRSTS